MAACLLGKRVGINMVGPTVAGRGQLGEVIGGSELQRTVLCSDHGIRAVGVVHLPRSLIRLQSRQVLGFPEQTALQHSAVLLGSTGGLLGLVGFQLEDGEVTLGQLVQLASTEDLLDSVADPPLRGGAQTLPRP